MSNKKMRRPKQYTHKYVFQSAITAVLLKHRNSTTDILSLLGHSYLHFQILNASLKSE